jgi:hypothetical protein
VRSNGYAIRFRQACVRFDDNTDGLHILAGEAYSLLVPLKSGFRLRQPGRRRHRVRHHLDRDRATLLHGQHKGRRGAPDRWLVYLNSQWLRNVADRRGVSI